MWIGFEYKKIDVQGSLQENVEIYDMVKIKKILFMEEFLNYFFKKKDRDILVIVIKKGIDVVF